MEKIGYVILISAYLLVFPLAGGLSEKFDKTLNESISQESLVEKIASDFYKAIGFDSFFDSLNRGF